MMPVLPSSHPHWLWNSSQRLDMEKAPWKEALCSNSLCCYLNFHGEGQIILANGQRVTLSPQSLAWCRGAQVAYRTYTRVSHDCLTLAYPDEWLTDYLREVVDQVPEKTGRLLFNQLSSAVVPGRALNAADFVWSRSLMMSCISDAARRLLDTARMTDFLLQEIFSGQSDNEAPAIISRSERAARERVERVKHQVRLRVDENHSLESLAVAAGCSPHYLSRTFAQIAGIPLMLWIRRTRIERAAELIASGRCNVSEAAFEVGYSSFSHFSRAFHEEKGVSPSKWISHLAKTQTAL